MPRQTPTANPFYVLLVLVGAAFVVTTFAYALMAFQTSRVGTAVRHADEAMSFTPGGESPHHPLWRLLSRYGNNIILWELGLVITFAVAAMATDSFWQRRGKQE